MSVAERIRSGNECSMIKTKKRWLTRSGLVLIIVVAVMLISFKVLGYYQARSYLVMSIFSKYEQINSLLAEQRFDLKIPGGLSTREKDWYPFVMIFNDDEGFSRYMNRKLDLTILYNFGAFNRNASSTFFLDDSEYFNSFYGAYVVKENSDNLKFGFKADGQPDCEEIFKLAEYDYKYLVLKSLDCPDDKLTMNVLFSEVETEVSYAGYNGWSKIDASLLLNSPAHQYKGERRAYIQYGKPQLSDEEEFKIMNSYGRIYARYFPEFKCTVFLYILSPELTVIDKCDKEILSKTIIQSKKKLFF